MPGSLPFTHVNTLMGLSDVLANSSLTQAGRNDDSGEFMVLEAQGLLPMTWHQLSASDWVSPKFCSYFQSRAEYIISDTCGPFLEQDNMGAMAYDSFNPDF